jgi:ribonucleoside-diphosphate reductase alpha chain
VAQIGNEKGRTIFRQENVEVPKGWSQTATNIVASKYFHGKIDTPERETSVRQLIGRVVTPLSAGAKRAATSRTPPRATPSATN